MEVLRKSAISVSSPGAVRDRLIEATWNVMNPNVKTLFKIVMHQAAEFYFILVGQHIRVPRDCPLLMQLLIQLN